MFKNCNLNLIYCIKEANSNNEILRNEIESNYKVNNCSDICFYENKKIIFDHKTYALNYTDINKYDYNNICFSTCPDGVYNLGDKICMENQKCIDSINENISLVSNYMDYFHSLINSNDKDNIITNIRNELNLDIFILKDNENEQKDKIIKEKI